MRQFFKILSACFFLYSILLVSCSEKTNTSAEKSNKIDFSDFSNIPDSPFLNLNFGLTTNENITLLNDNSFILGKNNIYYKSLDSTSVIVPEIENFNAFKIYLKSSFYLIHNQELFKYLSDNSFKTLGTYQFGEMTFKGMDDTFSLTYFTTDHSIRISYQLLEHHG